MGLAFIPIYLTRLGTEGFGLIGFFALLQAWLSLLDLGIGQTLSREIARFHAAQHTVAGIWRLIRSCELFGLAIAGTISLLIWLASDGLALHWIQGQALSSGEVAGAVRVMALVIALRVLESLYRGALIGAQRHAQLNLLGATIATLRWGGAAAVLVWVRADVATFFAWQALASAVAALLYGVALYAALPRQRGAARFSWRALADVSRFSTGMLATALLALVLTQMDKVVLSRILSLEAFGSYSVAVLASNALYQLVGPVTQAYAPRFAQLAARQDEPALRMAYHRGAQTLAVVLTPAALLLAIFAEPILRVWTQDADLAQRAAPVLTLLALGTWLNGVLGMAHMLQLAHGWPGLAVRLNLVAVALWVPALLWTAPRHGPAGTAALWLLLNLGLLLATPHLMHKRLLPGEQWRWYWTDTAQPALAAASVVVCSALLHPASLPRLPEALWLGMTGMLAFAAAAAATARRAQFRTSGSAP